METYYWNVEVSLVLDSGHTSYLFDECGWDEESHLAFLEQIRNRTHYALDGFEGKIRVRNEKRVETAELVDFD